MAWNPSPKVADCRAIADKWNVQQVIIFAVQDGILEYASFGKTKVLCDETKRLADAAFDAILKAAMLTIEPFAEETEPW